MERSERLEGVEEPILVPAGVSLGYARVSTVDQNLESQRRQLIDAGCYDVYADLGRSGATMTRPELEACLRALQPGNTLVVTKLDRLARSLPDARDIADELTIKGVALSLGGSVYDPNDAVGRLLFNVLGMVAEFEADLIRLRTREGMAIARSKGKLKGKKPKLSPSQRKHLLTLHAAGEHTQAELAELFNVSRTTIYRELRRTTADT